MGAHAKHTHGPVPSAISRSRTLPRTAAMAPYRWRGCSPVSSKCTLAGRDLRVPGRRALVESAARCGDWKAERPAGLDELGVDWMVREAARMRRYRYGRE